MGNIKCKGRELVTPNQQTAMRKRGNKNMSFKLTPEELGKLKTMDDAVLLNCFSQMTATTPSIELTPREQFYRRMYRLEILQRMRRVKSKKEI